MTLEDFNSKYRYQSDKEKFGFTEVWDIPELQEDGFYYGDCESYCLFLKNNTEQFEDWDLYHCKLNGIGHCILSNSAMIIDCNSQKTILKDKFMKKYNIKELKKYNKFIIFSKYLFAKAFLFFKGK
jgi:hypothetical protein